MKAHYKKILKITLTLSIFILLGFYLYSNRGTLLQVISIKPQYFLIISGLTIITLYIQGLFIKVITKPFNIHIKEHFQLSSASSFINMVTPFRGGAGFRAYYCKKKLQLPYSQFLASLFGNYLIIFFNSSAFALIIFALIAHFHQIFNLYLFLIFLAINLSSLALIIFQPNFQGNNYISRNIKKIITGWTIITKDKSIPLKLWGLTIINLIIKLSIIKFTFSALSYDIPLLHALYLGIISTLSAFINITPGSLGVTETLFLISSSIVNISPEVAVLVALIERAINIVTVSTIGSVTYFQLLKKLKTMPKAAPEQI